VSSQTSHTSTVLVPLKVNYCLKISGISWSFVTPSIRDRRYYLITGRTEMAVGGGHMDIGDIVAMSIVQRMVRTSETVYPDAAALTPDQNV